MKPEILFEKLIRTNLRSLRFVLLFPVVVSLAACQARSIAYRGTCAQQTQQFADYVYSVVMDELTPAIEDGFRSESTADVIEQIEKLDAKVSKLNTPECNPRTQGVKDALRIYLLETRSYFSVVAGRAVYGEGPVQAQRSKMYEAGLAFEAAFIDMRK